MTLHSTGKVWRRMAAGVLIVAAGCSSGGGGGGALPPPASGWVAGSFLPPGSFVGRCVNPRAGTNPANGLPYTDIRGTTLDENNWLRSWSNHLYLWYDEIVDRDPGLYSTPNYFEQLKTAATTPSGAPKDKFHFSYRTSDWLALIQSGTEAGYGVSWSVVSSLPPRRIVVAYIHASSPAAAANLVRGEEVVRVDGVDVVNDNTQMGVDTFFVGLFPEQTNETHSFVLRDPETLAERTVTMTSATVAIEPVQNVSTVATPIGNVGYIQFNDHLPTAEQDLISAFSTLASQNVVDLVLDLRYNGGGSLAIASEVAYMIAGAVPTAGRTFERIMMNDKQNALTPMPFFATSSTNQPLPALNLSRVYVLTGSTTCSASESIINGLRGVNVEVVQMGSTTCGKPYGFLPEDNCGTTYFTIQMKGVNEAGFGDYGDGFSPNNTSGAAGVRVPGCSVHDDFGHPLGDPAEARYKAALDHRLGMACPAPSGSKPWFTKPLNGAPTEGVDGSVRKGPWLMNRWLDRL